MSLPPIKTVRGTAVVIPGDDIDTDRIIPARFLKCVTFDALGPQLFYDERYHEDGTSKGHPLDAPGAENATILVSGHNFGSGSSREHAPQSIHKAGFRGLIAGSFAEIFFGNSTTLGMPCVTLASEDLGVLQAMLQRAPETEVEIDVENCEVRAGGQVFPAVLPDGAQGALTDGRWDPLADLLEGVDDASRLAHDLGYLPAEGPS